MKKPVEVRNDKNIRILLVDDHDVVREGLRAVLQNEADIEIVGETATGKQAIESAISLKPDIMLLDIKLPDIDGFKVAEAIRDTQLQIGIIMLTGYESDLYAAEAAELGVRGFLSKNTNRRLLINSIKVVRDGGKVLHYNDKIKPAYSFNAIENVPGSLALEHSLKPREREILALLVKGLTNKEIALKLGVAEVTIKKRLFHLLRKLNVTNRTQAAIVAKQLHLG